MHEEHRHGPHDEGWGPPRPGRPKWGPGPGRGDWGPGGPGRGRGGPREGFRAAMRRDWPGRGGWGWGPGPMPPEGMPHFKAFGRRVSRARRGDVRAAILDLLSEGPPWNGYQIIREIAGRTQGVWRPSPGSVYPTLQQLEDEGLIEAVATEGEGPRRLYTLSAEGRAYVEAHADEIRSSWDAVAGMADDVAMEMGDLFRQVAMATMEVRRAGSASQLAEARRVLVEARRSLYRILADDGETSSAAASDAETGNAEAGDSPPEDDE